MFWFSSNFIFHIFAVFVTIKFIDFQFFMLLLQPYFLTSVADKL